MTLEELQDLCAATAQDWGTPFQTPTLRAYHEATAPTELGPLLQELADARFRLESLDK